MTNIEEFQLKLRVKNNKTGDFGTVCPSLPGMLNCNTEDEVSVVYDDTTTALGTNYRLLEIIGEEKAIASINNCGGKMGANCCIFLSVGSGGAECQRFGDLRWGIIFRKMKAKRHPKEPFPECQKF